MSSREHELYDLAVEVHLTAISLTKRWGTEKEGESIRLGHDLGDIEIRPCRFDFRRPVNGNFSYTSNLVYDEKPDGSVKVAGNCTFYGDPEEVQSRLSAVALHYAAIDFSAKAEKSIKRLKAIRKALG